jgi:hypothetical protein
MIARFFYSSAFTPGSIFLEMQWHGERQMGVLHVPLDVLGLLEGTDYASIKTGETLAFPLSLGLGVALAALTFFDLIIGGDKTVWLDEWGALETLPLEDQASDSHAHDGLNVPKFDA